MDELYCDNNDSPFHKVLRFREKLYNKLNVKINTIAITLDAKGTTTQPSMIGRAAENTSKIAISPETIILILHINKTNAIFIASQNIDSRILN